MGEINVSVKLTNWDDLARADRGEIRRIDVRTAVVSAIVDTGAVRSVLPEAVVRELGVPILRRQTVTMVDGRTQPVSVTGPIQFEFEGRDVVEQAYVLGREVLLGQTALECTDLVADCVGRKLVQNPEHPDGPAFRV